MTVTRKYMEHIVDKIRESVAQDIFTDDVLMNLLHGTPDRRYGLIKRAIAAGKIVHIRRGLYALAKQYQRKGVNLFELAQLIYGPSYISFESALDYHGWIPEAVYAVTSACAKKAREFATPYGTFLYTRIPFPTLYCGVERVASSNGTFLMADPWKALVDLVYAYKRDWTGIDPVIKSLRIEKDTVERAEKEVLFLLEKEYKNRRVEKFIHGVKKDLGL